MAKEGRRKEEGVYGDEIEVEDGMDMKDQTPTDDGLTLPLFSLTGRLPWAFSIFFKYFLLTAFERNCL